MQKIQKEAREIKKLLTTLEMCCSEKRAIKVARAAKIIQDHSAYMDSELYSHLNRMVCAGKQARIDYERRVYANVGDGTIMEWLSKEMEKI